MSKGIHCCQSVTGPLMNWKVREWRRAAKYMTKGNGESFENWQALKSFFIEALAEGYKVLPMCKCPNFDKEKGCQGYETE